MSNTDSFIEEVTEEVRKDRLYSLIRRWWWVAALLVVLIVGGAAFNEWRKAREAQKAQAFGDALLQAATSDEDFDASTAVDPTQKVLAGLLQSSVALGNDDPEAAEQALVAASGQSDAPAVYKDLAAFKEALLLDSKTQSDEKISKLDAISAPGAPFRTLALEQKAIVLALNGKTEEAISALRPLLNDAEASSGLQQRATQLIIALGGDPEEG